LTIFDLKIDDWLGLVYPRDFALPIPSARRFCSTKTRDWRPNARLPWEMRRLFRFKAGRSGCLRWSR
jgi:hypothetical protein